MSEMIERVARAMYHRAAMEVVKDLPNADREMDGWTLLLSETSREVWRDSARAAIEAMREPTERMQREFNAVLGLHPGDNITCSAALSRMIDAELRSATPAAPPQP